MDDGLCVTVTPCNFIYTGGQESGVSIGLLNYPRFPKEPTAITARAMKLAERLMVDLCQWPALVVTPEETTWINRRPE